MSADPLEVEHEAYRRGCLLAGLAEAAANGTAVHESKLHHAEALRAEGLAETFEAGRRGTRWCATAAGKEAAEKWRRESILESERFGEPTPPALPERSTTRVVVLVDGKIAADRAIEHRSDETSTLRELSEMTLEVGADAIYQLHGQAASDRWYGCTFTNPPPDPARPEPVLELFDRMLAGDVRPGEWSWHATRFDGQVHLVRGDEEYVMDPRSAYRWAVRAYGNSEREEARVLAGLFVGLGIPYISQDPSESPETLRLVGEAEGAARAAMPAPIFARYPTTSITESPARVAPVVDEEPEQMRRLAAALDLHPVRAAQLVEVLRSSPSQVSLLADALLARSEGPGQANRETISIEPPRPTLEQVRRDWPGSDEDGLQKTLRYRLRDWGRLYGIVEPKRSNRDVRRALFALKWAEEDGDHDAFVKETRAHSSEEALRRAVRPWPEDGWDGVEVGNVRFGKLGQPLWEGEKHGPRESDTPQDFYRLLYLFKPVNLHFDDMYGQGLFGITSPCRRFAMRFYFHKYELAAYQYVQKDLAVVTWDAGRVRIESGIPGSDNGVATTHPDARRWFRMIHLALHRKWVMYSGNDFEV